MNILQNHLSPALYRKIVKYVNSDPLDIRCSVPWIRCKQEIDKTDLERCASQLINLLHNHVPDHKYVHIFHIDKNDMSTQSTEPCPKSTQKMVFKFLASIYQRNVLASLIKYILIHPTMSLLETSQLMPVKKGIFYIMYQRLHEIIHECVLVAFNGSNYDNYLICNSLVTIQCNLKQKIKLFKKGSSISTIILTNNINFSRYSAHSNTKSKKILKNKWPMKLFIKDVRNLVAANMSLDKIGKLFNLEESKLAFPYEKAISIATLKSLDSLHPLDDQFWNNAFSGRSIPLETRLEAQQIFEQQGFTDLYQFSVHYLVQDCILLHSVLLTLFNTYLQDSINIYLRRNYSQSSLAYQQFFIVEPAKQIQKVLAPKKINNTFYNYLFKQAVTGGLCTSFVHGHCNTDTVINEHFNYLQKPILKEETWPNFHNLKEWKNTFKETPSGISTIDIRSLYPSASVKKMPVNEPLFFSRFTKDDHARLFENVKFYRSLNINMYCHHVRELGNYDTDIMQLISTSPRAYNEYNALNFYLNSLPNDIQIVHFQSYFTAFGQLMFVNYPVDGFLSYTSSVDNILHVKIIQYQSVYFHGHTARCLCPNTPEEQVKAENTLKITKEIIHLCKHFTHHFQNVLIPVDFEVVEISECDFSNHSIPKKKNFLPCFKSTYNYTKFLDEIYTQKLTGLLVVKNLKIAKLNQNPIFGFIIQKIEYGLKQMSPYTQEQVSHMRDSKRVVSVHECKEFMVISTEYFNWLRKIFGFENEPDIYHALLFQLDDYLRPSIENKLSIRKSLKNMIKQESDPRLKQTFEIKAELIKLMLNSCYGYTLCNLNSSKFKQFENRTTAQLRNHKNIVSCFEFSSNAFLVQTTKEPDEEFTTMLGHVGCYILFYSKIILLKRLYFLLKYLNPRRAQLLYMDTDSAHFLLKWPKFEDNVDQNLRHEFVTLYDKHFETGNKISGIWVEEGFFNTGEYLGEKCYRLFDKADPKNYITHMKGLNSYFQTQYHTNNVNPKEFPYLSYNNFFKSPDFLIFKTHMSKNLFTNYVPNKRYFISASGSLPLKC